MSAKEPLSLKLDAAIEACWRAGKITLEYFQALRDVELKEDGSPVTIADRRAEEEIRRFLTTYFPDDAIVGEEGGASSPSNHGTWYVDPIDGTKSFVCGVPLYGVLLAFEVQDATVLGVAHFPALDETVWALKGEGCFWNGRRAQVSAITELSEATLMVSDFGHMEEAGYARQRDALCAMTKWQRTWGDSYGHILVATGRADIMLDPYMHVWDCGPLLPILEEAGGRFTDWQGNPTIHGRNAVSTNGHLHDRVQRILSGGRL